MERFKYVIENMTTAEIQILWAMPIMSYIETLTFGSYIHV